MSEFSRREFMATSIPAAVTTMLPAGALARQQQASPERKVIDAWGHSSLPRFLGADEYITLLNANQAEAAVVGTAPTCPDLTELSHASVKYPDGLGSIGLALGKSPAERLSFISAQLNAGFTGIRLPAALIANDPQSSI